MLLEPLSSQATSELFLAQRTGAEELCVVKILHERFVAGDVARERFFREANLASMLIHPNIARVIDAGLEGRAYIAMELVRGHDLLAIEERLAKANRTLPLELALPLILDVLFALEHAHNLTSPAGEPLGVVHRDLSARNVMVTYDGEVKLIDFGVAHAKVGDYRTAPGMIMGTLRYMSPEQAAADPVDRRSDVYSAGVLLFELLAGRELVLATQPLEILTAIIRDPAPPPSSINPSVPPALDAVVARALEKDREDRFATAGELARAIKDAVPELGLRRKAELGALVSSLFAEEKAARASWSRKAEAGVLTGEMTYVQDSPYHQPTMTAPRPNLRPEIRAELRATSPAATSTLPPVTTASMLKRRRRRKSKAAAIAVAASLVAVALVGALFVIAPEEKATPISVPDPLPAPPLPKPVSVAARAIEEEPPPPPRQPPPPPPVAERREPPEPQRHIPPKRIERAPAPPPIPQPQREAPKVDPGVVALKRRLAELRASKHEGSDVLELSSSIKAEADRIRDTSVRGAVKSQAYTSGRIGDLDGLGRAIERLESALD